MKRQGNLFEQIVEFRNLLLAAKKAFRGHRKTLEVARFCFHLETELFRLQEELSNGSYQPRPYHSFEIFEPKRRLICAAPIRDRVVHFPTPTRWLPEGSFLRYHCDWGDDQKRLEAGETWRQLEQQRCEPAVGEP